MTESHTNDAFQCQAYQGLAGLAEISDAWRTLAGQSAQPSFYHYPEWYECYLQFLAPFPDNIFFCVLRRAGQIVAVAPLERRVTLIAGIRCRSLLFPQDLMHVAAGDFTTARTEHPGEVAQAILEGCASLPELRWDRVCLDLVPENTCCATGFQALHDRCQVRRFIRYRNHLTLQPFDQMLQGLSKTTRSRLRNAQNRLTRAGEVRFQTFHSETELTTAVDAFMDVEASGWKGQQGTAIKCNPPLCAFYRRLAARFGVRKQCDIHALCVNNRPVAALFVLHAGEMATFLKVGYDENYAALSPGNSVFAYAMQYYYENTAIRSVDFISDYPYLNMWHPTRQRVISMAVFDRGLTGSLAHHFTVGTHALKKVYAATVQHGMKKVGRWLNPALENGGRS